MLCVGPLEKDAGDNRGEILPLVPRRSQGFQRVPMFGREVRSPSIPHSIVISHIEFANLRLVPLHTLLLPERLLAGEVLVAFYPE